MGEVFSFQIDEGALRRLVGELDDLAGLDFGPALMAGGLVVEAEGKQNIIEKDIIDTGATLNSMQTVMAGDEAHIGPTTDYAIYHEMGTSRMAARPFLRPALAENKDAILRAVADALRAQIRGRR